MGAVVGRTALIGVSTRLWLRHARLAEALADHLERYRSSRRVESASADIAVQSFERRLAEERAAAGDGRRLLDRRDGLFNDDMPAGSRERDGLLGIEIGQRKLAGDRIADGRRREERRLHLANHQIGEWLGTKLAVDRAAECTVGLVARLLCDAEIHARHEG